ncbi:MAG: WG repeat-containing protein [Chitinophagales bacterium]|nr:WG repeat-containing protein [Chitinophagales bacterium]
MRRSLSLLFLITISFTVCFSQSLKKSVRCLERGDYFKAMEMISSLYLKDSTDVGVQYALARLYASEDYEFHNDLLANNYIKKAIKKVPLDSSLYDASYLYKAGIRDIQIKELYFLINHKAFLKAEKTGTIPAYKFFAQNYTSTTLNKKAKKRHSSLAFRRAKEAYNIDSFEVFIQRYPESDQIEQARSIYELMLYKKITADSSSEAYRRYMDLFPDGPYFNTAKKRYENLMFGDIVENGNIESYERFILKYPDNTNVAIAEDSIFAISTRNKGAEQVYDFIKRFPSNRNVDKAWQKLYKLETINDKAEEYLKFMKTYEEYPFMFEVKLKYDEAKVFYKPFFDGKLYGYIDTIKNDTLISARYTEASGFSGGLAAVSKEKCGSRCQYGYINKDGIWKIKDKFNYAENFQSGFAVVGKGDCETDNCKYGIIDKEGNKVIPIEYDEVYNFRNDVALVGDDVVGYGYFNKAGKTILALQYKDAMPFGEGKAAIKIDSCWYFINKKGETIWDRCFAGAGTFSEGLVAAKNLKGMWGYLDNSGKWFIEPKYHQAAEFIEGKAKVVIQESDPASNRKVFNIYIINKEGEILSAVN